MMNMVASNKRPRPIEDAELLKRTNEMPTYQQYGAVWKQLIDMGHDEELVRMWAISSQRDKNAMTRSQHQWLCNTTTTSWGHLKTNPSGFSSMGAHFITILVLTLCNTGQTSEALHHSLLPQQGASHGWTNNATSTCLELFSQMDI